MKLRCEKLSSPLTVGNSESAVHARYQQRTRHSQAPLNAVNIYRGANYTRLRLTIFGFLTLPKTQKSAMVISSPLSPFIEMHVHFDVLANMVNARSFTCQ